MPRWMPHTFAVENMPVRVARRTFFSKEDWATGRGEKRILLAIEDGHGHQLCHILPCSVCCRAVDVPSPTTLGEGYRPQSE